MVKLLVMSGVPGCGKSTWARRFISMHNAVVVSRDSKFTHFLQKNAPLYCLHPLVDCFICFYPKNTVNHVLQRTFPSFSGSGK